jgi:hypothetical protein
MPVLGVQEPHTHTKKIIIKKEELPLIMQPGPEMAWTQLQTNWSMSDLTPAPFSSLVLGQAAESLSLTCTVTLGTSLSASLDFYSPVILH